MNACYDTLETPIGPLTVVLNGEGALTHVLFAGQRPPADAVRDPDRPAAALVQLREYFAGLRRDFDLPLAPRGTAFQHRVWEALRAVEWGETVAYSALGERIGRPGAARAVGRANATNPLPIVVPCHRVVGRDGSPTGYAGGVEAKVRLLALEGVAIQCRAGSRPPANPRGLPR